MFTRLETTRTTAGLLGNILTLQGSPLTFVSGVDSVVTLGDGGERDIAGRTVVTLFTAAETKCLPDSPTLVRCVKVLKVSVKYYFSVS